jgi:hypothetical protein
MMRTERTHGWSLLLTLLLVLAAPVAQAQQEVANEWPRVLEAEKGNITIYQPQIESFQGDDLETRAAVAVERQGKPGLIFGAVWFKARLLTDRESRTATLEEVTVTAARFPELEEGQVEELSRFMEQEIPRWDLVISLDDLLAVVDEQQSLAGGGEGFNMAPPRILYRDNPAVLVLVDGEPHFRPLEDTQLEYLANTAFFIVRLKGGRSLFLRGAGYWFTSQDLTGQWAVTERLPDEVKAISGEIEKQEEEQARQMAEDAGDMEIPREENPTPPEVIVTTEPAELVYTDGAADMAPIQGTQLLFVRNTGSDVILDIASQKYYLLLAGRWYRSGALDSGKWEHVDPQRLPEDFLRIPADSEMGGVLASVPGTIEAREALLDNQIPQTAEVDRKTAKVTVSYDGDPEFEACGDGVAYARNTDKSVLLIDGTYYCCDEAVWFVASGPEGPWQVATELPAKIQDLPPECPVYNVKYVTIYDSTPEVVYVGYTPGYYGSYVYGPCVIYGTGWYYRPWYGYYYYPRPVTYGFGVHYNPYTGWGFSFGVSYGWLTVGVGWARPPYYGYWGAAGYRYGYRAGYWHGYRHGYHNGRHHARPERYAAATRNRNNIYRDRSSGIKRTGGDRRPDFKQPRPSDRRNDVYTDRDGKVYRDRDGKWEERDRGDWKTRDGDRPETRDQARPGTRERPEGDRTRPEARPETRDRPQRDQNQPATRERDRDRQPERAQPQQRDRSRQQLERDRNSRNRSLERQRQAPQRQSPQRRAPSRPSGGARRR